MGLPLAEAQQVVYFIRKTPACGAGLDNPGGQKQGDPLNSSQCVASFTQLPDNGPFSEVFVRCLLTLKIKQQPLHTAAKKACMSQQRPRAAKTKNLKQ